MSYYLHLDVSAVRLTDYLHIVKLTKQFVDNRNDILMCIFLCTNTTYRKSQKGNIRDRNLLFVQTFTRIKQSDFFHFEEILSLLRPSTLSRYTGDQNLEKDFGQGLHVTKLFQTL